MKTTAQMLVAGIVGLAVTTAAQATTMVFQDRIMNYQVNSQYVADNPAVSITQIGGPSAMGVIESSYGSWTAAPGNQFAVLDSGSFGLFSTLAVAHPVTDQFGQIYVRLGINPTTWNDMVRIGMFNTSTPSYTLYTGASGAGADVTMLNGYLEPFGGLNHAGVVPTTQLFDLTINYDLGATTYDVWLNQTELVIGESFETAGFGSTVQSIAIGAAYMSGAWNGTGASVLDQWYWQTDNNTRFDSFGGFVPEPTTFSLFALGLGLCWWRRR